MEVVMRKHAHDSGEFATREDAAAWVAGAVLAFPDAEEVGVRVARRDGRGDSMAPAHFMWRSPSYWSAEMDAWWAESVDTEPPPMLDMTAVRDALVGVTQSAHALRGGETT